MDVSDVPASDGVMIAFLPSSSDWAKVPLPHMTLVYAGKKSDLKASAFSELAKDAASLASLASPFYLVVNAVQQFGPDNDRVNALALQPTTDLWAMRRFVEKWNQSEHPFSPHVTIGSTGFYPEVVPRTVGFNRLYFGWGDDGLTFWLNNNRY